MRKKKKGQFFIMSGMLFVFLMYLFTTSVLKQDILQDKDTTSLERIDEILYYVNNTINNLDLNNRDQTYLELLVLQHNIERMSKVNNLNTIKLNYVYDKKQHHWNVSLIVENEYISFKKEWK